MSSSRRWRLAALIAILTRGRDRWRGYLTAHGYPYHYFADLREYGVDSSGWYDRIHLTESATLRMLLALFEEHPALFSEYTDTEVLRGLLENASNPMDVLGELPQ